jgi:hypothetical protein
MSTNTTAVDEQRNDPIAEDDIRRGWTMSEVPAELQAEMQEAGIPVFTHIRLTRLNPTRRRKITEVVQRAYFKDLKDGELLSVNQVKDLVAARGEWTPKHEQRLALLNERTTSKMMTLYHEGVRHSTEWLEELGRHRQRFLELVEQSDKPDETKRELRDRFERWFAYTPRQQAEYQDRFPHVLGAEGLYYPDRDLSWLMDNSPTLEAADLLEDVDTLNMRIQDYITLVEERSEYDELRVSRLRIFANTVESRRDNAEEMARVFHCTERCDDQGTAKGPIMSSFEQLYDLPDGVISWLVEEQFFFHNSIPAETREFLKGFGFLGAGLVKTETAQADPTEAKESPMLAPHEAQSTLTTGQESGSVPSAESPVAPIVRPDSTPAIKTL